MRKFILLSCLLLIGGCNPQLSDFGLPAPQNTGKQQKAIGDIANSIEGNQKTIIQKADEVQTIAPKLSQPKIIEEKAHNTLLEVVKLRDQNSQLKEKQQKTSELEAAQLEKITNLTKKVTELEKGNESAKFYFYLAMSGLGAVGVAVGFGIIFMGYPKFGIPVAGSAGVFLILGLTIQEYGVYLAGFGAISGIIGLIYMVIKYVGKKKDHADEVADNEKIQLDLVRSVHSFGPLTSNMKDALDHIQHPETKERVRKLKEKDGLGKPRIQEKKNDVVS